MLKTEAAAKILITCSGNKYRVKLKYSFAREINNVCSYIHRWKFSIRPSPVWVHNGIVWRVEETCCASFYEVWLKDIGPRSYARYSPIRSPEPPPNEFGRSWSQVSVAHSRKLSSEYRQQTQRRLYELVRRQTPTSYTFEPSK